MKKAFKTPKLYIIALVLIIVGVAIPFGILAITLIPSVNADPFPYPYLLPVFPFLYLLLGFTISDIQLARWRRKNAEYDTKVPEEIMDKAWQIRFPFYFSAAILFLVFLFFEIWFFAAHAYPFIGEL